MIHLEKKGGQEGFPAHRDLSILLSSMYLGGKEINFFSWVCFFCSGGASKTEEKWKRIFKIFKIKESVVEECSVCENINCTGVFFNDSQILFVCLMSVFMCMWACMCHDTCLEVRRSWVSVLDFHLVWDSLLCVNCCVHRGSDPQASRVCLTSHCVGTRVRAMNPWIQFYLDSEYPSSGPPTHTANVLAPQPSPQPCSFPIAKAH